MFRCNRFRFSSQPRPLALVVVLALTLSATVATAQTMSPGALTYGLRRDLGALHAQLEQIDPSRNESRRQMVAFNTDLGDGSAAFGRLSMVTIVQSAARRFERLIAAWRAAGDEPRVRGAEALRLRMYGLTNRIAELSDPSSPAATIALRDETEAHLTQFDRALERVIAGRPSILRAPPGAETSAAPTPQP